MNLLAVNHKLLKAGTLPNVSSDLLLVELGLPTCWEKSKIQPLHKISWQYWHMKPHCRISFSLMPFFSFQPCHFYMSKAEWVCGVISSWGYCDNSHISIQHNTYPSHTSMNMSDFRSWDQIKEKVNLQCLTVVLLTAITCRRDCFGQHVTFICSTVLWMFIYATLLILKGLLTCCLGSMADVPRDLLQEIKRLEEMFTVDGTKLKAITKHFVSELAKGEYVP